MVLPGCGLFKSVCAYGSGESSKMVHEMDFRTTVGANMPNQEARVFDNAIFSQISGAMEMNSSGGSRISKINGCLDQ